jgi:hypothetical protein
MIFTNPAVSAPGKIKHIFQPSQRAFEFYTQKAFEFSSPKSGAVNAWTNPPDCMLF